MNSVIQLLNTIPEIRSFFSELQTTKPLAMEMKKILQQLSEKMVADPQKLINIFGWETSEHHDAAEWLMALNDRLEVDISEYSALAEDIFGVINDTYVAKSIEISKLSGDSLQEIINQRNDILLLSKYLIINATSYDESGNFVDSVFETSAKLIAAEKSYDLLAVILHMKMSEHKGHYTALIKVGVDWWIADDSKVSKQPPDSISKLLKGNQKFKPTCLLYSSS